MKKLILLISLLLLATPIYPAEVIESFDNKNISVLNDELRSIDFRLKKIYPVGSLYFNASVATNPSELLGFGTWEAFGAGRVLVGINTTGTFTTAGATGGVESVTLTSAQSGLPAHSHGINTYTSSGAPSNVQGTSSTDGLAVASTNSNAAANAAEAHTNLQPYIVVYIWQRTK